MLVCFTSCELWIVYLPTFPIYTPPPTLPIRPRCYVRLCQKCLFFWNFETRLWYELCTTVVNCSPRSVDGRSCLKGHMVMWCDSLPGYVKCWLFGVLLTHALRHMYSACWQRKRTTPWNSGKFVDSIERMTRVLTISSSLFVCWWMFEVSDIFESGKDTNNRAIGHVTKFKIQRLAWYKIVRWRYLWWKKRFLWE